MLVLNQFLYRLVMIIRIYNKLDKKLILWIDLNDNQM